MWFNCRMIIYSPFQRGLWGSGMGQLESKGDFLVQKKVPKACIFFSPLFSPDWSRAETTLSRGAGYRRSSMGLVDLVVVEGTKHQPESGGTAVISHAHSWLPADLPMYNLGETH